MSNGQRQEFLYNYFKKPIPETYFVGRINFSDLRISCSKTKKLIEEGKYKDWSDIRLPFLLALRRRGYQPEAFIQWTTEVGISQTDKTVTKEDFFKSLDAYNKDVIDPVSNRYFFVWDPEKVKIEGSPEQEVELELHLPGVGYCDVVDQTASIQYEIDGKRESTYRNVKAQKYLRPGIRDVIVIPTNRQSNDIYEIRSYVRSFIVVD